MENKSIGVKYKEVGYEIIEELPFDNIKEFMMKYTMRDKPYKVFNIFFSFLLIIISAAALGYMLGLSINNPSVWIDFALFLLVIVCGIIFLIPTHEIVHWIVYKNEGAADVRFGAQWKRFVFYAAAHDFPADYVKFRRVALAPLYMLGIMLGLLILFPLPLWLRLSCIVLLMFHILSCTGDITLLRYFKQYRGRDVITVDDIDNKTTYFMEKLR